MKNQNKTKSQLITELEQLRSRVAELERTEEMLKESEEKYRTIYENVSDHLIYIDKYGTILDTNDHKETYGRSLNELIGKNFTELGYFDDDDLPKYLKLFKDVITGKKSLSGVELEIKHKDGHKIPVEVSISLIRKNDKIEGFLCVVRNITERKQAEEQIQQRTEDLSLINELNNAINQGLSLKEVIDIISRRTVDTFSSHGALVLLLSPDGQSLKMENIPLDSKMLNRIEELTNRTIMPIKIALKKGNLCWEWMHSDKPQIINDPRGVRDWLSTFFDGSDSDRKIMQWITQKIIPQIIKLLDIKSIIVVPLISEGNTFGLLQIARREPFTESDLKRFEILTKSLTSAIVRKRAEKILQENEEKYRAIFEHAVDSIVLMDAETGELVEFNDSACENLGYTRKEFERLKITDFEATESDDDLKEHLSKVVREGSDIFETKQSTKNGKIRDVFISARTINIPNKNYVLGVWRDITDRKQSEAALQESEEKYRALVESSENPIYLIDENLQILYANQKYLSRLGESLDEVIGQKLSNFDIPQKTNILLRKTTEVIKTRKPITYEHKSARDNRDFLRTLSPVIDPNTNSITAVTVISKDITELKLAEKQLRESREQLRSLSAHLQSIREEERSEMARHIHDVLGQELTALKMDLALLKSQMREDQEPLLMRTQAIAELTDSIIQSVKDIATRLRPAMLDDLGVAAALEWEMEEFEKRWGIECNLTVHTDNINLDSDRSTAVYRIFMESLTNIARHAQATSVTASLSMHDSILEIKIKDNGIGITKEQIISPRSFGLIGIRERILQFQGETIINGEKGKGTTLTVRIPLDDDNIVHN